MIFTGKVKFYNSATDKDVTEGLFISATNYREAMAKIIEVYGEEAETDVQSVTLSVFSPDNLITFDEKDMKTFKAAIEIANRGVFW